MDEIRLWAANILAPLRAEAQGYAKALNFNQATRLRSFGLNMAAMMQSGLVGVSRVEISKDEKWAPADQGRIMLTVAVYEADAITDIVAFDPASPNEWFLRTGNAWALGINAIEAATDIFDASNSVFLHATPLDWLRYGMGGACVLDWTPEAINTLRAASKIEVPSPKFAQALRLQLSRPPRLPEIRTTDGMRHAA